MNNAHTEQLIFHPFTSSRSARQHSAVREAVSLMKCNCNRGKAPVALNIGPLVRHKSTVFTQEIKAVHSAPKGLSVPPHSLPFCAEGQWGRGPSGRKAASMAWGPAF